MRKLRNYYDPKSAMTLMQIHHVPTFDLVFNLEIYGFCDGNFRLDISEDELLFLYLRFIANIANINLMSQVYIRDLGLNLQINRLKKFNLIVSDIPLLIILSAFAC